MKNEFESLFEQIDYLIRRHGFRGGYSCAAGMGFELEAYFDDNAPEWFNDIETELVTDLAMWKNSIQGEDASFSIKKRGSRIYLSSSCSSGQEIQDIPNHKELMEGISRLLNFSKGMRLCYSDEWDPLTWDGEKWEDIAVFYPEYEDQDYLRLSKTKSLQLARFIKKYIPDYECYKSVGGLTLFVYDDRISLKVDSVKTKYEEITNSLKGSKPVLTPC